jgi:hypothetical protein
LAGSGGEWTCSDLGIFGLVLGLVAGLEIGLARGLSFGLSFGLVGGLVGGLVDSAWFQFLITTAWQNVYRGGCLPAPRRVMPMLRDCHRLGLLRHVFGGRSLRRCRCR